MHLPRPLFLALLALVLLLPACASSLDRHRYTSTVDSPKTIVIRDPYTDHVYWSMDIPVEHTLYINLNSRHDMEMVKQTPAPADSMQWELTGPLRKNHREGRVNLPGTPVLIDLKLRPAPEYPADFKGPTEISPQQ